MNKNKLEAKGKRPYLKPQLQVFVMQTERMLAVASDFNDGSSTVTGEIDEVEIEES